MYVVCHHLPKKGVTGQMVGACNPSGEAGRAVQGHLWGGEFKARDSVKQNKTTYPNRTKQEEKKRNVGNVGVVTFWP